MTLNSDDDASEQSSSSPLGQPVRSTLNQRPKHLILDTKVQDQATVFMQPQFLDHTTTMAFGQPHNRIDRTSVSDRAAVIMHSYIENLSFKGESFCNLLELHSLAFCSPLHNQRKDSSMASWLSIFVIILTKVLRFKS